MRWRDFQSTVPLGTVHGLTRWQNKAHWDVHRWLTSAAHMPACTQPWFTVALQLVLVSLVHAAATLSHTCLPNLYPTTALTRRGARVYTTSGTPRRLALCTLPLHGRAVAERTFLSHLLGVNNNDMPVPFTKLNAAYLEQQGTEGGFVIPRYDATPRRRSSILLFPSRWPRPPFDTSPAGATPTGVRDRDSYLARQKRAGVLGARAPTFLFNPSLSLCLYLSSVILLPRGGACSTFRRRTPNTAR